MDRSKNSAVIADFVRGLQGRTLPSDVIACAKQSLIDWFAVCLAARADPEARMVADLVHGWGSRGDAVAVDGRKGAAGPIALINGALSHALDFDDFHISSLHHAGGPTLAAVLALGMDRGRRGEDMLTAFVAGFEVGTRLGMNGIGLGLGNAGWHPTCILGHFSAAVGSAAVLRLDAGQIERALGFAAIQAGGLMASAGTIGKPFVVGKSAFAGVMAAELAEKRATVPTRLLDIGAPGLFATLFQKDIVPDLDDLGTEWQMTRNTFKPYSACQLTHASIDAAKALAPRIDPGAIKSVRAVVHPFAVKVAGYEKPATTLEARFSLKHCIAMGLLGLAVAPTDFCEERLSDNRIKDLRDLITIATTEDCARTSSRLEITLADGTTLVETTAAALGSLDRPMSWADTEAKFMSATAHLPGDRAGTMLNVLRRFEEPGAAK